MVQKLEGHFFHVLKDGKPNVQGRVVSSAIPGWYLVEFFSWIDGGPAGRKLYELSDMKDWIFYRHETEWVEAVAKYSKQ